MGVIEGTGMRGQASGLVAPAPVRLQVEARSVLRRLQRIELAARVEAYPSPDDLVAIADRLTTLQRAVVAGGGPRSEELVAAANAARRDIVHAMLLVERVLDRLGDATRGRER